MKARGFTLIEVMVAVAVFAAVLLGSLAFVSYGYRVFRLTREQGVALNIARNVMTLKDTRDPYQCPVFLSGGVPRIQDHYVEELSITFHSIFDWHEDHTPFAFAGSVTPCFDSYKVVSSCVTWISNTDGRTHIVALHSVAAQPIRHHD